MAAIGAAPVTMQNNTCGRPEGIACEPVHRVDDFLEACMTTSLSTLGHRAGNAAWPEATFQRNAPQGLRHGGRWIRSTRGSTGMDIIAQA